MNNQPDNLFFTLPSLVRGSLSTILDELVLAEREVLALPLTLEATLRYLHLLNGVLIRVTNEEEMRIVRDVLSMFLQGHPSRYPRGQEPPVHQMMLDLYQNAYDIMRAPVHCNTVFHYLEQVRSLLSIPFEREAIQFLCNLQNIVNTAINVAYLAHKNSDQKSTNTI